MKLQHELVFSVQLSSLWVDFVVISFELVGTRFEIEYFLGFGYSLLLRPSFLILLFPSDNNLSDYVDWLQN